MRLPFTATMAILGATQAVIRAGIMLVDGKPWPDALTVPLAMAVLLFLPIGLIMDAVSWLRWRWRMRQR